MYIINGKKYPTTTAAKQVLGIDAAQSLPSDIEQIEVVIPAHDPNWEYADWDYNDDGSVNGIVIRPVQRYARLQQGLVVEICANPADDWVVIPLPINPWVAVGWLYIDGVLHPPGGVGPYLSAQRQYALTAIANAHAEMLTLASGGATGAERDTWGVQEAWARKILSTGEDDGTLRPLSGETKEQLAIKIIGVDGNGGKAAAYRKLVGIASEIKRIAEKAVEALVLESVDDLTTLDALLESARQQAAAALAAAFSGVA